MSERERWERTIRSAFAQTGLLRDAIVVDEIGSTQDLARERAHSAGAFGVVVALRQTGGRGRHGRSWADTENAGLAMTVILPDRRSEVVVMATAVATARAIERACGATAIGIKWPNDLLLNDRKLAGILVERPALQPPRLLVGIGVNVGQRDFGGELMTTATSLAREGCTVERLDVALCILGELDRLFQESDQSLLSGVLSEYLERDALRGRKAVFDSPAGEVEGLVLASHPIEGIRVRTSTGERVLPPQTTVLRWWGRAVESA